MICGLAFFIFANTALAAPLETLRASIKGIAPGSTQAEVLKALGPPAKTDREAPHAMAGMGEGTTLTYPGLLVDLMEQPGAPEPSVWRLTLVSREWMVAPGLHIGSPADQVSELLGQPESCLDRAPGIEELFFHTETYPRDTWLNIALSGGKISGLQIEADWADPSPSDRDDLIFEGGLVVDGTGAPAFRGDIAVSGDKISAVGFLTEARKRNALRRIDAGGLVVAPGFVDLLGQSEYNILVDPRAASKITQGITTEVTGEGSSIAPTNARMIAEGENVWKRYGVRPDWTTLAQYFARVRKNPPTINLGTFVGIGGVRNLVIGEENRPATEAQINEMERVVEQAMLEGALGVSTSLQYVPDMYSSTEEIIALAKVAARYGGVYFTHQRSEGNKIDESLDEVFRIAREARIPANVWHFKVAYKNNWGKMGHVLERLEQARAEGLDVAANQYPWEAGENGLDACLPPWIREGGAKQLLARLKDPTLRERARREMDQPSDQWENQYYGSGGASGVLLGTVLNPELKKYEGMSIAEIAKTQNKDPRDALIDIVIADQANSYCIIFIMTEDDVRTALKHRLVAFGTDSGAEAEDGIFSQEKSHPRAWGSTAKILGKYVRGEKVLSLEEAVRKMTSLSAARAHLFDRGLLRPGMAADIAVFDPATVASRATYTDPIHYSTGFRYVAVNGQLVVEGGQITAARPGRILLGPGARKE
jgi:dihydroorotase/N-acyl-D-amino-acid deacylase